MESPCLLNIFSFENFFFFSIGKSKLMIKYQITKLQTIKSVLQNKSGHPLRATALILIS